MAESKRYLVLGTNPEQRWQLADDIDAQRAEEIATSLVRGADWVQVKAVVSEKPTTLWVNVDRLVTFAIIEDRPGKASFGGVRTMGERQI